MNEPVARNITRRRLLTTAAALPVLQACVAPLPKLSSTVTAANSADVLQTSAVAHGFDAFWKLNDLNVSYAGKWHSLVGKFQPSLVDAGFRGGSEERLMLREGLVAQAHAGPKGHKHVVRHTADSAQGSVQVWFNDEPAADKDRTDAAALVVDGYSLFLLGPMLLARYLAQGRSMVMELDAEQTITVNHRKHLCEVLRLRMQPGVGLSDTDDLALYIDQDEHLMRRVRFTLNGLESTRGAIAQVDTFEHQAAHGVQWPTGFSERLLRPAPLAVHDWRLTGLDVNRHLSKASIEGASFAGKALEPAAKFAVATADTAAR